MATTTYTPGQRVGIVSGLQSVDGPRVTAYGTVVEAVQTWNDTTEYVVQGDDGERLMYRAYMLRAVRGEELTVGQRKAVELGIRAGVLSPGARGMKWDDIVHQVSQTEDADEDTVAILRLIAEDTDMVRDGLPTDNDDDTSARAAQREAEIGGAL